MSFSIGKFYQANRVRVLIKSGQGSYYNPDFLSGSDGASKVEGYSTNIITDKALAWLKNRDEEKPILLCANFKVPHIHRIPSPTHMGGATLMSK